MSPTSETPRYIFRNKKVRKIHKVPTTKKQHPTSRGKTRTKTEPPEDLLSQFEDAETKTHGGATIPKRGEGEDKPTNENLGISKSRWY
ncbi:hypothetical protein JTE90_025335 [Oedothorax gibbosus]|uniref:Uncharacterized protein n=1 Tax=Oedothorax gibbosus TaxID=931172 RepID=A0AAV6V8Y5_9ARAC|nr:hypothetical protein JTE90_025335 [Oedothorax gibbosus]